MGAFTKLIALAPNIVAALVLAVFNAEGLYKGIGQGQVKKDFVMGIVKPLLTAKNYITGGDGDSDNTIIQLVSDAIDMFVKVMNTLGGFGGGEKLDFTLTDAPAEGGDEG